MNLTTVVMGAIAWPLLCHAESSMVHAIVRSCDCFGLFVNNGVINLYEDWGVCANCLNKLWAIEWRIYMFPSQFTAWQPTSRKPWQFMQGLLSVRMGTAYNCFMELSSNVSGHEIQACPMGFGLCAFWIQAVVPTCLGVCSLIFNQQIISHVVDTRVIIQTHLNMKLVQ
jgi:hypothetical protein